MITPKKKSTNTDSSKPVKVKRKMYQNELFKSLYFYSFFKSETQYIFNPLEVGTQCTSKR